MSIHDAYKIIQSFSKRQTQEWHRTHRSARVYCFENESDKAELREALLVLMHQCPYTLQKRTLAFCAESKTEIIIENKTTKGIIYGESIKVHYIDYFDLPRLEMVAIDFSKVKYDIKTLQRLGFKNIITVNSLD